MSNIPDNHNLTQEQIIALAQIKNAEKYTYTESEMLDDKRAIAIIDEIIQACITKGTLPPNYKSPMVEYLFSAN